MDRHSRNDRTLALVAVLWPLISPVAPLRAEPGAAADQAQAPETAQTCHIQEFTKPIFPEDPHIMFVPVSARVEATMGAASRCSFGVRITLPCLKKLGARLETFFKVNGEEEEGKKLVAGFAASEEEMNKSLEGVSFGYTVQAPESGGAPKFSKIVAVTINEKGRKQKETFADLRAFQKAYNMSEAMNVDDSVKKLCALNDTPDDKFAEKLGELAGQPGSKK